MLAARRGWSFVALPLERLSRLWARLEEMRRVIEGRRDLARLDEQTLADIGVTRADVLEEIRRMPWDTKPRKSNTGAQKCGARQSSGQTSETVS